MELHPEDAGRRLRVPRLGLGHSGTGWADQQANDGRCGDQLVQQLQPTSTLKLVTPVRFPPGRLRLATSPSPTGSLPTSKTIGIVVVAAFAAMNSRRLAMSQSPEPKEAKFSEPEN